MVEMRRLNADKDQELVRQALSWIDEQPTFYRNCDAAWGTVDADSYLEMMRSDPQADFGVFEDDKLIAVITVTLEGKGIYNSHLLVKRRANVEAITICAMSVIKGLFENGMKEGWSWLARKNYGARKILESIGMRRDGVSRFKGQSHGQPIEWLRYGLGVR